MLLFLLSFIVDIAVHVPVLKWLVAFLFKLRADSPTELILILSGIISYNASICIVGLFDRDCFSSSFCLLVFGVLLAISYGVLLVKCFVSHASFYLYLTAAIGLVASVSALLRSRSRR